MQPLERNGYTEQEIRDMLHGKNGSRVVSFRYDVLDKNENKKGELSRVLSGEVSMSAFSTIKRTAKFTLEDEIPVKRAVEVPQRWNDFEEKSWEDLDSM